ncbi:helix-turn-helix transcriptional regulator [Nitrospirillum sp. BR 11164]|uniref:helix-turn-helix domain-containing protein n=1 Tax=Nitrospirillum sp. BR 11164 TaxID=3104324 RepID=UPI002AFE78DC|nr:helix-turn-helix transcriptional regulator [Nitrospirillum sp. BR 11164]MEA1647821.1 helix-turn-helix transcriptional regulator [Nitrospirillum sp. BR 11164]
MMVLAFATACFSRMAEDIRIQFGKLLRQQRKVKGLTQEELAGRAGMAVPYLSDLERGKWNPSLAMIVDLARGLGVEAWEILHGLEIDRGGTDGGGDDGDGPELPERKRGGV